MSCLSVRLGPVCLFINLLCFTMILNCTQDLSMCCCAYVSLQQYWPVAVSDIGCGKFISNSIFIPEDRFSQVGDRKNFRDDGS